jgi:hypothetical protein
MRNKLIGVLVVAAVSIAFGVTCLMLVSHVVGQMEVLSMEAQDLVDQGKTDLATEKMVQLAGEWEKFRPFLEMLISHDEMHTVVDRYVEAGVNLERNHLDDFYKSMALLQESLRHILNQEQVRWGNVL